MSAIFGILLLLTLIAWAVGLVNPSLVRRPSRLNVSLIGAGATIVLFVLVGITSAPETATPTIAVPDMVEATNTPGTPDTAAPSASHAEAKAAPATAPATKTWHTVTTLSGDGIKTTAPFTIQGSQWRANWKTTGQYNFQIFPARTDGDLVSCPGMANIIGSGSDTSYCYQSGEFYLTVNTGNTWTISIEDYY